MPEQERSAAVALLAGHIEELAEAKRDGDDDLWEDLANDGVEVVVGGATWEVWLGAEGWTASRPRPTQESEIGSAAFGEGDLIGTVGPATLPAGEIIQRIGTLEDAAARSKRASAALRDARAILRRLDVLMRSADGAGLASPSLMAISEARAAAERMVGELVRDEAQQRRMARDAVVRATRTQRG